MNDVIDEVSNNAKKLPKDELELVFPTASHKEQMEEYIQEFLNNGEPRIPGSSEIQKYENYNEWLEKVQNDTSNSIFEGAKVPTTVYLTIRKSDSKIVGNLQIRHCLNEKWLKYGGHIGDSVRPSERKKGYATEQIRLALLKCKELGIDNVLMDCDKSNTGSAKSIQNNGGELDKEVYIKDELVQKYWVSLKKRYADRFIKGNYKESIYKIMPVKADDFTGDVVYNEFKNVKEKIDLSNGKTIIDNNYKWLGFYDYNANMKLTALYNDKSEVIEWYFDVARKIGKENGVPYEDDLYLDVVVTPSGDIRLLDEDELLEAYGRYEVNENEFDMAHDEAKRLMERLNNNVDKLKMFTDNYLKRFENML